MNNDNFKITNFLIDKAEKDLGVRLPFIIKNKLIEENGFVWGGFRFFSIFDKENKENFQGGIYQENYDMENGWLNYLSEEFIAIASLDNLCLALSKFNDGIVYIFDRNNEELYEFAENELELRKNLNIKEGILSKKQKILDKFLNNGIYGKDEIEEKIKNYTKNSLVEKYPKEFIASLTSYKTRNGKYFTKCVWTNFIPTVMPECDFVVLVFFETIFQELYIIEQKRLVELLGSFVYKKDNYYVIKEFDEILDERCGVRGEAVFYKSEAKNIDIVKSNTSSDKKYFIKYLITSEDNGKEFVLQFYDDKEKLNYEQEMVYCSKVNEGQTLMSLIKKEMFEMLGISQFELISIEDDGYDFDKFGNKLERFSLVIYVPFINLDGKRFKGFRNAYMRWREIDKVSTQEHNN